MEFLGKKYVRFFSYLKRKYLTRLAIDNGEIDQKYEDVTVCLDGTHIPIWNRSCHPSGDFYSYKNKDYAYNVLVKK